MRVTAEAKEQTRKRILDAARELFRSNGFEAATTRDLASAAGIATGTLFNYFPTKEAIVTSLVLEALDRRRPLGKQDFQTLEEALFAYVAESLRLLKPYRKYLAPLLQTSLSPLTAAAVDDPGQTFRVEHIEGVVNLARQFGLDSTINPVAMQIYWSLYLGMLNFWINDKSPKQEDTLALIDQSLEMFASWLQETSRRD